MAQILDMLHPSTSYIRMLRPIGSTPFKVKYSYNYRNNSQGNSYNSPPFIWDAQLVASTADSATSANLAKVESVWKCGLQLMAPNSDNYSKEYLNNGVYYPIADTVAQRVRGDMAGNRGNIGRVVEPIFDNLVCVYHFKDGSTVRDTKFCTKKVTELASFIDSSGNALPFYVTDYGAAHTANLDAQLYADLQRFETGQTYNGHPVYGTRSLMASFDTVLEGTINASFKASALDTLSTIAQRQADFYARLDYVTLEPVYTLHFGFLTYKSSKYTVESSAYPLYYEAGYTSVRMSSTAYLYSAVFNVHGSGGTTAYGWNYDNLYDILYTKYSYTDPTKSYSTYDKDTIWDMFDVNYDSATDTVSVTSLYALSGWQAPYNIADVFEGGSSYKAPIPFIADSRVEDSTTATKDLLRSNYWRVNPDSALGFVPVTIVSNGDGTFTYKYRLGKAEDGWPTEPFTGALINATTFSTMQGTLRADAISVASPSDLTKSTVSLNDTSVPYVRGPVYTVDSFTIRKGNDIVRNTVSTQYRNVDKAVTVNMLVTPSELEVPTANTPGWGYEYVNASHATPSTGATLTRVGNTSAVTSTVVADAFEDTDFEGAYVKLNVYKYTGVTYDSKVLVETLELYFVGEYYDNITPAKTSVYINGVTPTVTLPIDTTPATSEIDTLNAECSNTDVATIVLDDHTLSITQVDAGRCTVRIWSTVYPGSEAFITVLSGSTDPGGADDEPDDYENYPVPTDPEEPLSPEARAQHAYFYDFDWRTSQLKQHCGGFDHGIGRGTTHNAAPGTLYIVYSEHSKREYFRDGVRTNGAEDAVGKYVPIPLLQGDDVWHTDYEAPAFLDTGNIADRSDGANKRFREVQYILALDGDVDMQVAFAFLVDGAMRRPMLKPIAEYDPDNDVITVSTEYDEPYSVAESVVGNLGEWKLDSHTLENAERVRVRQNVTGKGITASTRIVFKMSGQFKLLGVNYVYREMYSR